MTLKKPIRQVSYVGRERRTEFHRLSERRMTSNLSRTGRACSLGSQGMFISGKEILAARALVVGSRGRPLLGRHDAPLLGRHRIQRAEGLLSRRFG